MFVNLTPHPITVVLEDEKIMVIDPAAGVPARVAQQDVAVDTFDGVPLFRQEFGQVIDLPDPVDGTMLIVSALVRAACPDRLDLASPTGLVRDAEGKIIGCRGLAVN